MPGALAGKQAPRSKSTSSCLLCLPVQVLGRTLCLAGYPPFHTGSAELYHVGRLKTWSTQQLDRTLQKYLRTEQRFGK